MSEIIIDSPWKPNLESFYSWLNNRNEILEPGLAPEPTIKILLFLALFDAGKPCTYEELKQILKRKNVVTGIVPDNTLRTSILNLAKTLEKFQHPLELKASRGRFQLQPRQSNSLKNTSGHLEPLILTIEDHTISAEEIAKNLIQKAALPFHALYFLEWSAKWWETFSYAESQIRAQYEANAWEILKSKGRFQKNPSHSGIINILGLAPGEGLAEIELIKKILSEKNNTVHYIAIDSSPRLLRDHIGLLKEALGTEIKHNRLVCAGAIANIFTGLEETIHKLQTECKQANINQFFPSSSGLLVTYFGNCLGNNYQDQETEIFSLIHSIFKNRPLELLVGVSVMQSAPDEYKRNWDDFLLQTPKHLLTTKKLLESVNPHNCEEPLEFTLSTKTQNYRCPKVIPEPYVVRHGIKGQIYRFYYKLAHDLGLATSIEQSKRSLPKGTLILLYSIIKYNIATLVNGVEKCGLFKISYNKDYHQVVDTANGKREYAVFAAYTEL